MSQSKFFSPDPRLRIEALVEKYMRGVFVERETAIVFVDFLADMQAFDVVEECARILPSSLVPAVQAVIAELAARGYPGNPIYPLEWRHFENEEEREACYQKMHVAYQEICTRLEAYWCGESRPGEGSIHDV